MSIAQLSKSMNACCHIKSRLTKDGVALRLCGGNLSAICTIFAKFGQVIGEQANPPVIGALLSSTGHMIVKSLASLSSERSSGVLRQPCATYSETDSTLF